MKTKNNTIVWVLMIIIGSLALSCEKKAETPDETQLLPNTTELKIKSFLGKIKQASEQKSEEMMPTEEALWNLGSAINFTRGDAAHEFANRAVDTLLVSIQPQNGMINLSSLSEVYYNIQYHLEGQLGDQRKLISTTIIPTEGKSGDLELNVVTISGELGEDEDNNTGPGWYWGFNLGMCDGTLQGETDAVDELNTRLNRFRNISCPIGARIYFTEQEVIYTTPLYSSLPPTPLNPYGFENTLLFYTTSACDIDPCLSPEAISYYCKNVRNIVMPLLKPEGKTILNYFLKENFSLDYCLSVKLHDAYLTFGKINYSYEYCLSYDCW